MTAATATPSPAAVLVADPRPGMSQRPDRVTVDINVCEHPAPVREVRRICDTISETLGFRTLRQFAGRDVLQLKLALHALGYLRPDVSELSLERPSADVYDPVAMEAVDRFRADQGWADRGRRIRRREDDLIGRYRHRSSTACSKRRVDRRNGSRNTWASIRMPQSGHRTLRCGMSRSTLSLGQARVAHPADVIAVDRFDSLPAARASRPRGLVRGERDQTVGCLSRLAEPTALLEGLPQTGSKVLH